MIHDTQSAQISQKQYERNIYVIMKTMCPPGYHHNGFVAHDVHEKLCLKRKESGSKKNKAFHIFGFIEVKPVSFRLKY